MGKTIFMSFIDWSVLWMSGSGYRLRHVKYYIGLDDNSTSHSWVLGWFQGRVVEVEHAEREHAADANDLKIP